MKTTPMITKAQINEFGSKLNQFIASNDWIELIPDTMEFLQNLVDSRSQEDAEVSLAELDHMLTYDTNFLFNFGTELLGSAEDHKYSCILQIGSVKRPYVLTVLSRP